MIMYALPLIPNKLSWNAVALCNRVVIVQYLGTSFNGLYALANRFSSLINVFYGFFYQSWIESAARVQENNTENEQIAYYQEIYNLVYRFMLSVIIVGVSCMPVLFRIMIAKPFESAVFLIPFLFFAVFFDSMASCIGGIFSAYKDTKVLAKTTIFAAIVNFVICLVMVRTAGVYAAAISTLVANATVFFYRQICVRKYVKLKIDSKFTAASVIVATLVIVAFYNGTSWSCVMSIVCAFVYFGVSNKIIFRSILHRGPKK